MADANGMPLRERNPDRQAARRGDPEDGNPIGNGNAIPPLSATPGPRPRTIGERFKWFIEEKFLELGISIVALVFGILSLLASWKALDIAKAAYSQGYYAYEAQKLGNRLSFMQLCALNLTKYADTCAKLETWDYLPSVYDVIYPGGGGASEGQPPGQLALGAGAAAGVLGGTAGGVFVISIAMLVWVI